jgi:hypothetical protein
MSSKLTASQQNRLQCRNRRTLYVPVACQNDHVFAALVLPNYRPTCPHR